MLGYSNMGFGATFKHFLLKSEFGTLSEFGDILATQGYAFDDSTFSRWQHGNRIPQTRTLLLLMLEIFVKRGGITSHTEANTFLESACQGYLTDKEANNLFFSFSVHVPFQVPQAIVHFTGRNSTIKHIHHVLKTGKTILLHGPPGIGKTALAITVGHELRHFYPDGILWCRLDTSTIMDILATIATTYGENVSHIKNEENRASIVRSLLSQKKLLMILDNADPHHDIRLLLPNSTQVSVLITSQNKNFKNISFHEQIAITPFTKEESLCLCKSILGSAYVKRNRAQLEMVNALTGHLPLAVNLLARQVMISPTDIIKFIHQIKKEGLQLEEFGYENKNLFSTLNITYGHLPPATAAVFSSLGVFEGRDFVLPAIAHMHRLSPEKTERTLDQLVNLSLVERSTKGRLRIHPVIKQFIRTKGLVSTIMYETVAAHYVEFLCKGGRGVAKFYPAIEQERENIQGIFSSCYRHKRYRQVIQLWEYLGVFLWDTGRWNQISTYETIMHNSCKKEHDQRALALCLLREFCWLHYWQGDIKKAEVCVRKGLKIATSMNETPLTALAWIRLGKIYESRKLPRKALRYFTSALAYFAKMKNQEKQGDILTYIGETYWLMGRCKEALHYLHRALTVVDKIGDIPQKITIVSRLGCIALQKRLFSKAIRYFNKSLFLEKQSGRRVGDTFWNNLALGLLYEKKKNEELAREKFRLAKEEMAMVGFTDKILATDVFPLIFWKELAKSQFYATSSPVRYSG